MDWQKQGAEEGWKVKARICVKSDGKEEVRTRSKSAVVLLD